MATAQTSKVPPRRAGCFLLELNCKRKFISSIRTQTGNQLLPGQRNPPDLMFASENINIFRYGILSKGTKNLGGYSELITVQRGWKKFSE